MKSNALDKQKYNNLGKEWKKLHRRRCKLKKELQVVEDEMRAIYTEMRKIEIGMDK